MAPKRKTKAKGKGRGAAKTARKAATKPALEFNHAMIYTANYENAVRFYRDLLGFKMIDEYPGGYGRLQSPGGRTTIALHMVEPGQHLDTAREGVRLYFEIPKLDAFCQSLMSQGVTFEHPPKDMPWGWRHAYLRDPDGHELSFYWAGAKRFRKTTMGDEPR